MSCLRSGCSFEGHHPNLIAFGDERIRNVERERDHVMLRGVRLLELPRPARGVRGFAQAFPLPGKALPFTAFATSSMREGSQLHAS